MNGLGALRAAPGVRRSGVGGAVLAAGLGTALLTARPALAASSARPVLVLVTLFAALAVVGALVHLPPTAVGRRLRPGPVLGVGLLAVTLARLLADGRAPGPLGLRTVALGVLAAISEEIWFRRLVFGLARPAGATVAIGVSALLFALVHVPIYGWWVLPIDVAAGLLLGWQREVVGSWRTPAATHAWANVVVLL